MVEVAVIDEYEIDIFGDFTKQIFTIHHSVLAHYSLSFRRLLAADANSSKMTLHGCEAAFGILQNWFYTQKIEGPAGAIPKLVLHPEDRGSRWCNQAHGLRQALEVSQGPRN